MRTIDASAEEAVLEMLQKAGPCSLDDLVMQLPNFSWSEVFLAVDRMSREGLLLLRRLTCTAYQVALPSRHTLPPLPLHQTIQDMART